MNKEIINGNDIIAEYLNFKQKSYTPDSEKLWCDDVNGLPIGELKFHSDWNWLMPVVKKISQKDHIIKAGLLYTIAEYDYDVFKVWQTIVKHIIYYKSNE